MKSRGDLSVGVEKAEDEEMGDRLGPAQAQGSGVSHRPIIVTILLEVWGHSVVCSGRFDRILQYLGLSDELRPFKIIFFGLVRFGRKTKIWNYKD